MVACLRAVIVSFLYLTTLFLLCEFFIYYIVIWQCNWNNIEYSNNNEKTIKAVIIADTHLLGFRNGHWFDKLRREHQMHRSFQTLVWFLKPELVFFLGDLFDEGLWADDKQFKYYVQRFYSLFYAHPSTKIYVAVGNHDIGFHYSIRPELHKRFVAAFNSPSIDLVIEEENTFVLVNSMAMEGDGCFLCKEAEIKLNLISRDLKCAQNSSIYNDCPKVNLKLPIDSRPILMQHFPLYRKSDDHCEGSDVAPLSLKTVNFRESWDCLSKLSTSRLLKKLNPRLVFSGHTHYGCQTFHPSGIPEYSVPSFSWRNINNPSFFMLTVNSESYAISKCFLPKESTVINFYIIGILGPSVLIILHQMIHLLKRKRKFDKSL